MSRATVQKLDFSGGLPKVEHRTRDRSALLTDVEWAWSPDRSEAYVFQQHEPALFAPTAYELSAESHVAQLKAEGLKHVYAVVHSDEAKRARELREASAVAQFEAGVKEEAPEPTLIQQRIAAAKQRKRSREVTPQECFEREERRHLA